MARFLAAHGLSAINALLAPSMCTFRGLGNSKSRIDFAFYPIDLIRIRALKWAHVLYKVAFRLRASLAILDHLPILGCFDIFSRVSGT